MNNNYKAPTSTSTSDAHAHCDDGIPSCIRPCQRFEPLGDRAHYWNPLLLREFEYNTNTNTNTIHHDKESIPHDNNIENEVVFPSLSSLMDCLDTRLLWLSPHVFVLNEQTTCLWWLRDDNETSCCCSSSSYDARVCWEFTTNTNDQKDNNNDNTDDVTCKLYFWMRVDRNQDTVPTTNEHPPPQQQQQPTVVHPNLQLQWMQPALDIMCRWASQWSLQKLRMQSIRMTHGLPWLPLSHDALQTLVSVKKNKKKTLQDLSIRLFQLDARLTKLLGDCLLPGTLTLDRVRLDQAHVFLQALADNKGPTKLIIHHPYNNNHVWNRILTVLSTNQRLVHLELMDDHHVAASPPPISSPSVTATATTTSRIPTHMSRVIQCLHLNYFDLSWKEWNRLWKTLQYQASITTLCLGQENVIHYYDGDEEEENVTEMTTRKNQLEQRTRVVAHSMQTNTTIQTLSIPPSHVDDHVYTRCVVPCLERNQYQLRFRTLAKDDRVGAMLGTTLTALRHKPHLLYMYLHSHPETLVQQQEQQPRQPRNKRKKAKGNDESHMS